ncbi:MULTISPECIES: hypothetical protein [unclassified Vibrio]|uniref:hypothetical protein n=1 Tax=unclassified Vibrio TaxID=2614977 RepID=UPI001F443FF1|nr:MULTISPECIES: hypothetical protein [unclassified Vibrio]QXL80154.1 hypothetical protein [Vibrio sp.]
MKARNVALLFIFLLLVLAIVVLTVVLKGTKENVENFLMFTQNFQNLSMPIVTTLSVLFLYFSITQNTEQARKTALQQQVESLDTLINQYEQQIQVFLHKKVVVPYGIKKILADYGDDDEVAIDWDVNRLLLQTNSYLSISDNITQSNIRPAIYDSYSDDLMIDGKLIGYTLSSELLDLVELLKQREVLVEGESRNTYIFKRLEGLVRVLKFGDWLEDEHIETIKSLSFKDGFDPCCESSSSVETASQFTARVRVYEGILPDILKSRDKTDEEIIVEAETPKFAGKPVSFSTSKV